METYWRIRQKILERVQVEMDGSREGFWIGIGLLEALEVVESLEDSLGRGRETYATFSEQTGRDDGLIARGSRGYSNLVGPGGWESYATFSELGERDCGLIARGSGARSHVEGP